MTSRAARTASAIVQWVLLALCGSVASCTPMMPSPSDPCARYTTCAACTAQSTCGWCAGYCWTGHSSGPSDGTCGPTPWAWLSSQCTGATTDAGGGGTPDAAPVCQGPGQGLKAPCSADGGLGEYGTGCCPGLICSNGAHPPLHDNPYEYACSLPNCNNYDGVCRTDNDCCGELQCVGNVCQ